MIFIKNRQNWLIHSTVPKNGSFFPYFFEKPNNTCSIVMEESWLVYFPLIILRNSLSIVLFEILIGHIVELKDFILIQVIFRCNELVFWRNNTSERRNIPVFPHESHKTKPHYTSGVEISDWYFSKNKIPQTKT